MKNCKSCRFFAAPRGKSERFGSCVKIIHGNGDGNWRGSDGMPTDEELSAAKWVDPEKELAYVVDGSGYAARLKVKPDFGCVLHEPRRTPQSSVPEKE